MHYLLSSQLRLVIILVHSLTVESLSLIDSPLFYFHSVFVTFLLIFWSIVPLCLEPLGLALLLVRPLQLYVASLPLHLQPLFKYFLYIHLLLWSVRIHILNCLFYL